MEWIPHTLDSFRGLCRELGVGWAVFFVLAVLFMVLLFFLMRSHLGQVVEALKDWSTIRTDEVKVKEESIVVQRLAIGEIAKQTPILEHIKDTNAALATKMSKVPSDIPDRAAVRQMLEELPAKGCQVTAEHLEIIVERELKKRAKAQ